jgi:tetratricopeptide (TPR) repeat protein
LMERTAAASGGASAFLLLARLNFKQDPRAALRAVENAIAADAALGPARCVRGELLRRAGRFQEAFDELSAGIALGTEDARARVWLAKASLALGRRAAAFAEFDRARTEAPKRARVAAERGFALEAEGFLPAAERDYDDALRLESKGPLDLDEIVETAESSPEMEAKLHFRRFVVRTRRGDVSGGLRDLNAAHERDMRYSWRGGAEEGDGVSLDELASALSRHPRQGWLHAWQGQALNRDGRRAEAVDALGRALSSGADSAWAYAWRAEALMRLGRDDEARGDVREAAARDAGYPVLFGVRGELELRRDAFAAAMRHARAAIRAYPHAAWAYGLLGEALLGLGRRFEARRALDQALEWSPDYAAAELLRCLTFLDFRGRPPAPLFELLRRADATFPRGRPAKAAAASLERLIERQPESASRAVLGRLRSLGERLEELSAAELEAA